jgi:hypothetical protein
MNLHPIVVREHIYQTTEAANYKRPRKHGNAVWSLLLIACAVLYFGARMAA